MGLLRERAGDLHPLTLASGKGVPQPVLHTEQARDRERVPHGRCPVPVAAEHRRVRDATESHHVPDRDVQIRLGVLAHERDASRECTARHRGHRSPVEFDAPGVGSVEPGQQTQQRRLS